MRFGVGGSDNCLLGPFQFIPYNQKKPARKFSDIDNPTTVMKSCSLRKVLAKFPDNAAEMELEWLDESYVDLNVSNNDIYFKWKQSVPKLQGTIITFNLHCEVKISRIKTDHSYQTKCLRAKVVGTWSAGTNPTSSTPVVTKATMTSPLNQTGTMTMSSTTSARSGSDSDSSGTIIATAVVVVAVALIAMVGLVWLLCKRKKRNSPRNSNPESSCKDDGTACLKVKKKEINVASPDSTYSKKEKNTREDIERIDVNGDLYALPDKNKSTKKINGLNYMDPSRLVSGSQDGNESQAQSGQPTEYAEVVGVIKPAPKKPKKKK